MYVQQVVNTAEKFPALCSADANAVAGQVAGLLGCRVTGLGEEVGADMVAPQS